MSVVDLHVGRGRTRSLGCRAAERDSAAHSTAVRGRRLGLLDGNGCSIEVNLEYEEADRAVLMLRFGDFRHRSDKWMEFEFSWRLAIERQCWQCRSEREV